MQKIIVGTVVLILVILGVGGYLFTRQQQLSPLSSSQNTAKSPNISLSVNPQKLSTLQAGGNSYSDTKGVYSFLYPTDYALDTQDPIHIRIYKQGATQTGQTEMYDGVLIVFESFDLQGKTLEKVVDARIAESTTDGTSEIIEDKKAITMNNYPGFTYKLRGLGEATYLVLQKDPNSQSAVSITYAVMDPEQKNYQSEVDTILATLQLLK